MPCQPGQLLGKEQHPTDMLVPMWSMLRK
jgi:hypothetical protein